ncbi:MAG: hypothetical protein ACREJC_06985, partial [Tepidisphaeraceae bacterium]
DKALGLVRDDRQQGVAPDADDRFRAVATDLVQTTIDQRTRRIERLEQMLENEKRGLARDKADIGRLVEGRMAQLRREADDLIRRAGAIRARQPHREGPSAAPAQPSDRP